MGVGDVGPGGGGSGTGGTVSNARLSPPTAVSETLLPKAGSAEALLPKAHTARRPGADAPRPSTRGRRPGSRRPGGPRVGPRGGHVGTHRHSPDALRPGWVDLHVSDEGPGMTAEQRDHSPK
ncbi:hypothetical protein [Streptomyces canus]|uniref:hypothetical protein n=1 Tax=Streptomyces canus TaxID=58343 RepID=UPI00386CC40A|nr:hypothetical protein OH824_15595 [Streptomyces canus]